MYKMENTTYACVRVYSLYCLKQHCLPQDKNNGSIFFHKYDLWYGRNPEVASNIDTITIMPILLATSGFMNHVSRIIIYDNQASLSHFFPSWDIQALIAADNAAAAAAAKS